VTWLTSLFRIMGMLDAIICFGAYYSTYYNDSLNCYSTIDYLFIRNCEMVASYNVIDPVLNFSDHRLVVIRCCVVAKDRCCSYSNAN